MGRSRRLGAGVGVASWALLSVWTEITAFSTGYIGSVGGGCTNVAGNVAAAPCSLSSRPPEAAVPPSHSRRHEDPNYPFGNAAATSRTNLPTKEVGSARASFTCLRAVVDSSGGSKHSPYELARSSAQEEEEASDGRWSTGSILQRLSTIAFERSVAATPHSTISTTQTSVSALPSDPIERFSGDCKRIGNERAVGNNRASSEPIPSTPSDMSSTTSEPPASERFAEAGGSPSSSLADRFAAELRPPTILSGQLHRGTRNQSGSQRLPRGIGHGVQRLNSIIARVEGKLNLDSSETGQLREALRMLRSEYEAFLREHASNFGRMEAVSREYDDMRRRAAAMETELGRRKGHLNNPEAAGTGQTATEFGTAKGRHSREMNSVGAPRGKEGAAAASAAAASHKTDRGYRERLRTLSEGLASTQLQLAKLKSTRDKEKGEAAKARKDMTMQVARLEAQLKRTGEGVEKERADMEAVLLNLSNALSGVDVQLTQSAGMTPSRQTSRALRRAQEDFRRDRRRVKLLLEKQKSRYNATSGVMEEEAQRMRRKTTELIHLRCALADSESKEAQLKSNVSALGSRVSNLDKQLRKARTALSQEQELRYKTQAALTSSEKQREEEVRMTKSLWSELEATREVATSTRQVYEGTVKQREDWRKALQREERAKTEATKRAEVTESALRDEIEKNKRAAKRRERELAELKKQIVHTSRSLALSEEERAAETQSLRDKVDKLNQEASRLEAQNEDGKNLAARTVTRVSRRAFLNASQASQTLAPQGVLSKLGETINARFRNATSSAGGAAPATTLEGDGGGVSETAAGDAAKDAPNGARALSTKRLTNLVGGIRQGRGRIAAATSSSFSSSSSSSFPSSPSPPLSERAVKGVLGSVFTRKETAKEGGEGGDRGGVSTQASAAERAGGPVDGDSLAAPSATKKRGKLREGKLQGDRETEDTSASTAPDGNRLSGLLGLFGRPNQGSRRTKSPPPLTTPGPAEEPRQDNNRRSGDKTSRERRGVSAKTDSDGSVPPAKGATAAVTARAAASTAAPPARPGSATDAPGKPAQQGDVRRATEKAVHPDSKGRRRSREGTQEKRHWPDVEVVAGSSSVNNSNNLMDIIRAPWASLKTGGPGPSSEQNDSRKVRTDFAAKNGGNAVVTRINGLFRGRRQKGQSGSEPVGSVSDALLDEIGMGA